MKTNTIKLSLALFIMCILLAVSQSTPLTGTETAFAEEREINNAGLQTFYLTVNTEGYIEPLNFIDLSFQTAGEITEIAVKEGAQVKTGDVLIRMDDTELAQALDLAQARLSSIQIGMTAAQNQLELARAGVTTSESGVGAAKANLALIQAGPRPEEIAAAEAALKAAESAIAQATGKREMALDVISDADIFAAEAAVDQALAVLRALEDSYQTILDTCFKMPDGGKICPLLGPQEESAREQVQVAQLNYQAALLALDAAKQGPTAAQQRAAAGDVQVAMANRDAAKAQLDLLLSGATPEVIALTEIGVRQAEAAVEIAKAKVAGAEAAVQQAQAAIEQAQANVDSAQAALDRLTLRAPYAGTISRIDASKGQLAGPGIPVITLANFDGWLVKTTDLTELDVASVHEGQPASVTLDAIPNETITGLVTRVALTADSSMGDVVYEAIIKLDDALDLPIRWGMTAYVEIETGQ